MADETQITDGSLIAAEKVNGTDVYNRVGEKLFDGRVTIVSNPQEKNAETSPFTNGGLPLQREVWVENGVLKSLGYSRFWAMKQNVAPKSNPANFIMSGGDASLDDLIKSVKRGVLITRFWYIRGLNPRTISFTGLTRDGTFLIENGKIARPVTNFRFNQSIAELLAGVEMLGRPTRVAADESGASGTPVIVPPLKMKEFNLASVSDAI